MKLHQPHRQLRRNAGFTLLEMVIVLGIIAMLLGGAIYSSLGILGSSKMGRADADFQNHQFKLDAVPNRQRLLSIHLTRTQSSR